MPEPVTWRVGDTIADLYEVRGINTEGGMAIVHFVWHKAWQMELVIKSPRPELLADPTARERFVAEAETWVKLGLHPNIVTAYYVREIEGFPRIVMEKMDGGSLKQWLREGKVKDLATALDVAIQVASGLAYAQKRQPGFVHRDVKPANVLMTPSGEAKVTDFGLVGVVGSLVGTPAYMAPEVWTDPEHVTPASDLYSFGVLLYELLAGQRPFECGDAGTSLGEKRGGRGVEGSLGVLRMPAGQPTAVEDTSAASLGKRPDVQRLVGASLGDVTSPTALRLVSEAELDFYRQAHLEQEPAPPSSFSPQLPVGLNELCLSLLTKDPGGRLSSIADVNTALRAAFERTVGRPYPREAPQEMELLGDGLNNQAASLLDLGKGDEAKELWQAALRAQSHHAEATYNLALQSWRQGQIDGIEAVKHIQAARRPDPRDWHCDYLMALLHLERGNYGEAQGCLERIGAPDDNRKEVQQALAQASELLPHSRRLLRTWEADAASVQAVSFSDDGRYALSGGGEGTVKVWDVTTGACVRVFEGTAGVAGHAGDIWSVSFDGSGRRVLSGSEDGTIRLWDVETGRCMRTLTQRAGAVYSVALSQDGRQALSGGTDGAVNLWDIQMHRHARALTGHTQRVRSVALSCDGRRALSGSSDGTLKLWELATGRLHRSFQGHTDEVASVCFTLNDRYALSGSDDGTIKLWELETGTCIRTFRGHTDHVTSVHCSRGGIWALSGSADETVRLWEVLTGRSLYTFEGHSEMVSSVRLSQDGRWGLSGGMDGSLKLWVARCDLPMIRAPYLVSKVRTSESLFGAQAVYDREVHQARQAVDRQDPVARLQHLRKARSQPGFERTRAIVEEWAALYTCLPRTAFKDGWEIASLGEHSDQVTCVSISADGRQALSGSKDQSVKLWDMLSGRCVRTFPECRWDPNADGHTAAVNCVHLSADGRLALSGDDDRRLKLWETSTGRCLRTMEETDTGFWNPVMSAWLSPDGRLALSGHYQKKMNLWGLSTGRLLRVFEGHNEWVASVCLSEDSRHALSGSSDHTAKLWDVATSRCLRTFEGHRDVVGAVRFRHDARQALTGSADGMVRLWDVATGQCLRTFEGHTREVYSVALSLDGRHAISGSRDYTIKLWDLASGRCLHTLPGHSSSVVSVALSQDSRYIVSGSLDNRVKLWFLDWELEAREPANWDEGARSHLEMFLVRQQPYAAALPEDREPKEEITRALTRRGRPTWTDEDFAQLMHTLGCAGYGWLRPEGVRRELEKMAAAWKDPPLLPSS